MKKVSKLVSLLCIGVAIALSSCKKEEVVPEPGTSPVPQPTTSALYSGINISASIGGTVVDASNNTVSNALVTVGSSTTYTNAQGVFFFSNVTVDQKRAYIRIEKSGYFLGSRAITPSDDYNSYIKIELISKTVVGSYTNSNGGSVNIPGGAVLDFDPSDVSLSNGNPYSGTVNVYAAYLDPTASNIGETMPGDLMAIDNNDEAVILATYGMIAVELKGDNGEALNITPGETVGITMPVQPSQTGSAPSTIPLWHFDEVNGNWVEEGSANLTGNEYIGEVSHFSFWNCDAPFPTIPFDCAFYCYNSPLQNVSVRLTTPSGLVRAAFTDGNGAVSGEIPSNSTVLMEVVDECGTVIHSQQIPASSSSVNLGTLQVCSPQSTPIIGTVVDCNNNPVTNGLVQILLSNGNQTNLFTNQNGQINSVVNTCGLPTLDVTAFDLSNSLMSAVITIPSGSTINIGTITTCSQLDEFINYTVDTTPFTVNDLGSNEVYANGAQTPDSLAVGGYFSPDIFSFGVTNAVLGNNTGCQIYQVNGYNLNWPSNNLDVNITTIGAVAGSYVEGTFSGTFQEAGTLITHTISGNFRAKYDW